MTIGRHYCCPPIAKPWQHSSLMLCSHLQLQCHAYPTIGPIRLRSVNASLPYLIAHFGPTIARFRYRGTQHFVLSLIGDNAHGQIQIKIAMQCRTTLLHRYQAPFPCPASCSLSASFATPSVVPSISTAIAAFHFLFVFARVSTAKGTRIINS